METANSTINANLSLDDEKSPLHRLRQELTTIIERMAKSSSEFHEEVKVTLESFKVRREEAARSTRHGAEFEDAVGSILQADAQKAGDICEATGNTTGVIGWCKMGDHTITLGVESAPGARIAVEAKEDKSYDLAKALEEVEQARKNREAQVGLFVFSKNTAPANLVPFARQWQAHRRGLGSRRSGNRHFFSEQESRSRRALVIREKVTDDKSKADFVALKTAAAAISSDISMLAEITKWATTVRRNGEKIGKKAETLRKRLTRNLSVFEQHLAVTNEHGEGVPA